MKPTLTRPRDFLAATPQQLGVLLRGFRRELKLSQLEVARRGGLLQKTISKIENDPGSATIETLYRILSVLNAEVVLRDRSTGAADGLEW